MWFVFVLGRSGSGKTTFCRDAEEALGKHIPINVVYVGQSLRRLAINNPVVAHKISIGEKVSEEIIFGIMSSSLKNEYINIIDNYPQSIEALLLFKQKIESIGVLSMHVKAVNMIRKPVIDGRNSKFVRNREKDYENTIVPLINHLKKIGVPLIESAIFENKSEIFVADRDNYKLL